MNILLIQHIIFAMPAAKYKRAKRCMSNTKLTNQKQKSQRIMWCNYENKKELSAKIMKLTYENFVYSGPEGIAEALQKIYDL